MAKILVVDDDVKIAEMLREILEAEGHHVTAAHTGQEGGRVRRACPNCGQFAEVPRKDVVWEKPDERKGPQGPEARRVLVVDDNATYRHFLAFLLRRAGHVVLEAKSGREGLEFFEKWQPHLVIADVILPDVDGLTMARRIKGDPKSAETPIVLLTTFQAGVYDQQAKEIGAAYVAKPIQPQSLLSNVDRMLRKSQVAWGAPSRGPPRGRPTLTSTV